MYSSQWTAAIYNLISKDHIHWFLLFSTPGAPFILHPLPQPLDRWRNFHIVPNGSKYSQVMFTLMDGAQTLSRFCLFAVLYFIVFVIIIIIVVVVVVFFRFFLFVCFCLYFCCCENLRCRVKNMVFRKESEREKLNVGGKKTLQKTGLNGEF